MSKNLIDDMNFDEPVKTSLDLGDYFPSELDDFIITTRSDLMVGSILEQVQDTNNITNTTDILSALKERFNYIILINESNPEIIEQTKVCMLNVYTTIFQEMVCSNFDIAEETFEKYYHSINDIQTLTESAYEFFVLNRYKFILNLFKNIIYRDQDSFIASYKPEIDKKDIETYVNRKKLSSFDNVVLIMSMENIVNDIIETDFSAYGSEDPFDLIVEGHEGDFIVSQMTEMFGEVYVENFIKKFISPLVKNSNKYKLISDLSVHFTIL